MLFLASPLASYITGHTLEVSWPFSCLLVSRHVPLPVPFCPLLTRSVRPLDGLAELDCTLWQ